MRFLIAVLAFFLLSIPLSAQGVSHEVVTDGLNDPWGLAFLPGGDILVTEHAGTVRLIRDGELLPEPVAVIDGVFQKSQGGLFDVVLHPDFTENNLVYLSFATGSANRNATKLVRGTFTGSALTNIETVYVSDERSRPAHYGGRFVFLQDNTLVLTLGDSFDEREKAQDPSNTTGSLIRITETGGIPADNPFVGADTVRPETYSYGHRNPQAIVYDATNDIIYANEHGPKGGDELNVIRPGLNYGWPVITYGLDYSGARISPFTKMPGMEQPLTYWVPSIAPSGMAFYDRPGSAWQGDLFITSLVFDKLVRLDLENGKLRGEHDISLGDAERLRDVRIGPDGSLYVLAERPTGRLIRVQPQ